MNPSLYLKTFEQLWVTARDFISYTALNAPGGFGVRINTVMTTIQQLGERIKEARSQPGMNPATMVDTFCEAIVRQVSGLRTVEGQMRSKIPDYEKQLIAVLNELSALENTK